MAATFFGAGAMSTTAGTALGPAPPASTQADDIAIILLWDDEVTATYTIDAGWNHVSTADGLASGASFKGAAFWRRSTGTVPTPSITKPGSAQWGAVCTVWRGVRANGLPWSTTPTYTASGSDTSVEAATITTLLDGARIVMAAFHSIDSGSAQLSSWSTTSPGSLTEDMDLSTASGSGGGVACASADQTTAGATGAGAATLAASSVSVGLLLDLVPESAMTGYPTIVGTAGTLDDGANTTSHAVPYPTVSGGILANDIILIVGSMDDAAAGTTISNWNGYTELSWGNVGGTVSAVGGEAWRRAAGGESGTVTITSSVSERGSWRTYCIRGAHTTSAPEGGTAATGNSTNPDPPNLAPSWGSEKALWFATAHIDNVVPSLPPSLYSNLETQIGTSAALLATARKQLLASSDNPGVFTAATDQWRANTVAFRPASSGTTGDLPVATETDTAQALTGAKAGTVPVATTTDTAQALAGAKTATLPVASETDAAQAITGTRSASLTPAAETDSAQALAGAKAGTAPVATETDAAQAFTGSKSGSVTPGSETDTAQAVTGAKVGTLTPATETDGAQALTGAKTATLPVATEIDTAMELTPVGSTTEDLPPATETDEAQPLTGTKFGTLPVAGETDEAQLLTGTLEVSEPEPETAGGRRRRRGYEPGGDESAIYGRSIHVESSTGIGYGYGLAGGEVSSSSTRDAHVVCSPGHGFGYGLAGGMPAVSVSSTASGAIVGYGLPRGRIRATSDQQAIREEEDMLLMMALMD